MHRLINDVVTYSAVSQQRLEIKHTQFDIRAFVHRIVRSHRSFATVPITFEIDPAVPACMISDVMRLQQVRGLAIGICRSSVHRLPRSRGDWPPLLCLPPLQIFANALSNAAKFCNTGDIHVAVCMMAAPSQPTTTTDAVATEATAAGGSAATLLHLPWMSRDSARAPALRVQLPAPEEACPTIVFRVTDTGPGLGGDMDQSTLFDPFMTFAKRASTSSSAPATPTAGSPRSRSRRRGVDEATSSSYAARVRGSGLGLPVSKMLAALLEGSLQLFRDKQANRTVFCVEMPLVPSAWWPALHAAHDAAAVTGVCGMPDAGAAAIPVAPTAPTDPAVAAALQQMEAAVTHFHISTMPLLFKPPTGNPDKIACLSLESSSGERSADSSDDAGTVPRLRAAAAAAGAAADVSTPVAPPAPPVSLGLHVLVVDDERLNRQVLARMLMRLGCTYDLVEDGDDAEAALLRSGNVPPPAGSRASTTATAANVVSLDSPPHVVQHVSSSRDAAAAQPTSSAAAASESPAAAPRPYDVVLMDVVMRRRCGKGTTRSLREQGLKTPVFAATGNRPGPEYAKIFNGTLEKPFTQERLAAVLKPVAAALAAARADVIVPRSADSSFYISSTRPTTTAAAVAAPPAATSV